MHSVERMGQRECTPNTQCTDGTLRGTHRAMWLMKYSQTLQQSSNVPSSKVQLPGLHPLRTSIGAENRATMCSNHRA